MYEQLLQTIGNLGTPKILVAGDFMLDVYVYGDAARISPEAPVPILRVTQTESRCGGAGSVAADLAALGATPVCIGVVGEDANGAVLLEHLTALGADVSGICEVADRPTTTKQRLIGLAQHRHKQQLMRIDQESTDPLPQSVYDRLLRAYREALEQVDLVCLQDYDKGMLADAVCQEMIRRARAAGRRSSSIRCSAVTIRSMPAHLLTPNRHEAPTAVGFGVGDTEDAAKAARPHAKRSGSTPWSSPWTEGLYLCTTASANRSRPGPTVYDVTGAATRCWRCSRSLWRPKATI
jgi:D-beta-D-heptose 7-phosphate kinase/D-beta-D-heptose 1-phosphate adenosyltransferase